MATLRRKAVVSDGYWPDSTIFQLLVDGYAPSSKTFLWTKEGVDSGSWSKAGVSSGSWTKRSVSSGSWTQNPLDVTES